MKRRKWKQVLAGHDLGLVAGNDWNTTRNGIAMQLVLGMDYWMEPTTEKDEEDDHFSRFKITKLSLHEHNCGSDGLRIDVQNIAASSDWNCEDDRSPDGWKAWHGSTYLEDEFWIIKTQK